MRAPRSMEARGGAVVKALRYKPEGRGIDSRWCQNFWLTSFRSHYGPGVDTASNRNEYQECTGGQGWQPGHLMCRLSWTLGASNSWNPQGLSRPVMRLLYLYHGVYQLVRCESYVWRLAKDGDCWHWVLHVLYAYEDLSVIECAWHEHHSPNSFFALLRLILAHDWETLQSW
jgi:hypothetical protein